MKPLIGVKNGRRTGTNIRKELVKTAAGVRTAPRVKRVAAMGAALAVWIAGSVWGQDYGHDFVTVGAPGNRATLPTETLGEVQLGAGSVAYEYRITRTEVLTEQWLEFVQAYRPFFSGAPNDGRFTGTYIHRTLDGQGYGYAPDTARWPIDPSWEMAARYCNWLHNGKVNEEWAFQNGAYDVSTFTSNADGSRNDQLTRSAGARFWIPSLDELIKAVFYDPNRYGAGQEGYWRNHYKTDNPVIIGDPASGGTSNATLWPQFLAAGSYPAQQSPWGLLDTSGGEMEMTDSVIFFFHRERATFFSSTNTVGGFVNLFDPLSGIVRGRPREDSGGFRVASSVPAPSAVMLLFFFSLPMYRRNR